MQSCRRSWLVGKHGELFLILFIGVGCECVSAFLLLFNLKGQMVFRKHDVPNVAFKITLLMFYKGEVESGSRVQTIQDGFALVFLAAFLRETKQVSLQKACFSFHHEEKKGFEVRRGRVGE